jgi:replicative DNA helicase
MKIAELEQRVELLPLIAEAHDLVKVGASEYRVNPCPVCDSRDHFTVYPETNSYSSFSHCCQGGSVYKYLMEVEQMDGSTAYRKLAEMAGVEVEQTDYEVDFTQESPSTPADVEGQDNFIRMIPQLYQNQTAKDREYFINERGLSLTVIRQYQLFTYRASDGSRRAVTPIYEDGQIVSYVERLITGDKQYLNQSGAVRLFNIDHLKDETKDDIIVTESVYDALTLEARGFNAIALNGVNNYNKLKNKIIQYNAKGKLIMTAFDNDRAGRAAAEKLGFPTIDIPNEYKDINEWNVAEIESHRNNDPIPSMQDALNVQVKKGRQPDNIADYLKHQFQDDISNMRQYKDKKTGFNNLDKELGGVFPGLNVLGSITGGGKTTFVSQLADNMAKLGDHVLFFSLEQSKMEITSKSIARATAQNDLNSAVPSIAIRSGNQTAAIKQAITSHSEYAGRVSIIEGNFNTNAETIQQYTERYIQMNDVVPVVIVDYLQIMPAPDERMNDKQRMDFNVTTLKRMSRDLGVTVFAISSFNRGNYMSPIDFESFKESGGIEYTADLILGLQLEVIHDEVFNSQNKVSQKREKIKGAMQEMPRQMELVCLKNRNGNARFTCSYSYWAKYDYFEENVYSVETAKGSGADLFPSKTDYSDTYKKIDAGSGVFQIINKE